MHQEGLSCLNRDRETERSRLGRKKIVSSVLDMLSLRGLLEKYVYICIYIILYILLYIILYILLCGFFLVNIFPYQDIWKVIWDRDILCGCNCSYYCSVVGRILKMVSKIPTFHPPLCRNLV